MPEQIDYRIQLCASYRVHCSYYQKQGQCWLPGKLLVWSSFLHGCDNFSQASLLMPFSFSSSYYSASLTCKWMHTSAFSFTIQAKSCICSLFVSVVKLQVRIATLSRLWSMGLITFGSTRYVEMNLQPNLVSRYAGAAAPGSRWEEVKVRIGLCAVAAAGINRCTTIYCFLCAAKSTKQALMKRAELDSPLYC